jgi:hypothetical protein
LKYSDSAESLESRIDREQVIYSGYKAIIRLLEEKRRTLENKHDFKKEMNKQIEFNYNESSVNYKVLSQMEGSFIQKLFTLEQMLTLIDTSLVKLYVEHKMKEKISTFFQSDLIKCNNKQLEAFLKKKEKIDLANYTLALLYEVHTYYLLNFVEV